MGTSVFSLQILGADEAQVRAALPGTALVRRAGRFVTACLGELSFGALDRKANQLSKKLGCTVLAVSLFDGDVLNLSLYEDGRRLTRHLGKPETEASITGNPRVFCAALGLPPETAPKLRRLFACSDQEEKLDLLAQLLGAPLYARWDTPGSFQAVEADPAPLEAWLREHPLPPKVRSQYRSELIQEIPALAVAGEGALIFRPLAYAGEKEAAHFHDNVGDILGHFRSGGFWGRPGPGGALSLTRLEEDGFSQMLGESALFELKYAQLDGRLVTYGSTAEADPMPSGGTHPAQTVILADTAGRLPTPLPLALGDGPALADLTLLPDGGFLAQILEKEDFTVRPIKVIRPAALACYGPDGGLRWVRPGRHSDIFPVPGRGIYAQEDRGEDSTGRIVLLESGGQELACCPLPRAPGGVSGGRLLLLGGVPYLLLSGGYREDGVLLRLTPDLREDGCAGVPDLPHLALSPDGTLLYAAGFRSGLTVYDAAPLRLRRELRRKDDFFAPIVDGQNRLWVGNGGYFECYTPELELISRHRMGGLGPVWLGPEGSVCAMTYQYSKYLTRIYRLTRK